ncbi:DNA mismatch repair endonuclease MutL [Phototrophicus methaneseepsis]|uniref:DNA mismatch repair protein MutL n=1 Tax=Phototrophicus methaneseepsis TaxID=2710758 RepID=A0A7S8E5Y9_9CHLR|nr:DNA mismatch repair endonuclease MutL [Phototrophicus methaneseepsis]QPC80977.1 DNA mismatch repair endonuclease MutL [Phototrophicus methaneseepsis]
MAILILDEQVISQIAAGEVVERPASVVKELVENALDAGATFVQIEVGAGGQRFIRVSDDGIGIPADEVKIAVMRHATSKLRTADDLSRIETLGFRGEALSSIAAVSRLLITTRHRDETMGMRIRLEGGQVLEASAVGAPAGTVVTVENLFFNMPARKKFLKSENTEKRLINQIVMNYAMAYPHVRFVLVHDGREIFRSPGSGQLADVVVKVFGLSQFKQMVEVDGEEIIRGRGGRIVVRGFVSEPDLNRKDRSRVILFVNGRAVQDNSLAYAVTQAYHTLLPKGRYPHAVLVISVPPDFVDVNVHPTKAEIRFEDANIAFSAVQRAVREVILGYARPAMTPRREPRWGGPVDEGRYAQMDFDFDAYEAEEATPSDYEDGPVRSRSQQPNLVDDEEMSQRPRTLPLLRVIGQIGAAYIVTEGPAGMYLIDQHGAHQRILYELLKQHIADNGTLEAFEVDTVTIDVSIAENRAVEANQSLLTQLGFIVEPFGVNVYAVRAVPEILTEGDVVTAVSHIFSVLQQTDLDTLLMHLADVAAIKRGAILTTDQMQSLVRDLERCPSPKTDPFGNTTILYLSADQLAREFGRS